MFLVVFVCLSVCLSICKQYYLKSYERIATERNFMEGFRVVKEQLLLHEVSLYFSVQLIDMIDWFYYNDIVYSIHIQ